jgi:hypothetical protein
MKKTNLKQLVSLLVMIMFVVSFAAVAISQMGTEEIMTINGQITSINADTGKVVTKSESGQMITLTAGSGIDLKTFSVGDKVKVECDNKGIIKSITKKD